MAQPDYYGERTISTEPPLIAEKGDHLQVISGNETELRGSDIPTAVATVFEPVAPPTEVPSQTPLEVSPPFRLTRRGKIATRVAALLTVGGLVGFGVKTLTDGSAEPKVETTAPANQVPNVLPSSITSPAPELQTTAPEASLASLEAAKTADEQNEIIRELLWKPDNLEIKPVVSKDLKTAILELHLLRAIVLTDSRDFRAEKAIKTLTNNNPNSATFREQLRDKRTANKLSSEQARAKITYMPQAGTLEVLSKGAGYAIVKSYSPDFRIDDDREQKPVKVESVGSPYVYSFVLIDKGTMYLIANTNDREEYEAHADWKGGAF